MKQIIEIISIFDKNEDIEKIFYKKIKGINSYIKTKLLEIDYEGETKLIKKVIKNIYINKIRDKIHTSLNFYFNEAKIIIDIFLREELKDLEWEYAKDYVKDFLKGQSKFKKSKLIIKKIRTGERYYLFGSEKEINNDDLIKYGLVNPVINSWRIIKKK